jgi:hypothetical protein
VYKRQDVYAAVYDGALRVVVAPVVCRMEEFALGEAERIDAGPLLAGAVGRIAAERGGVDPAAVEATYVRPSDAELLSTSS